MVTKILTDVAAMGTFLGVAFGGVQLVLNRNQARTEFEDRMTEAYRALVADLPVEFFFGGRVDRKIVADHRDVFYRYFDLCNEQAFLFTQRRISEATWKQWKDGMEGNLRRSAFRTAWFDEIRPRIGDDFKDLKEAVESFQHPPACHAENGPEARG